MNARFRIRTQEGEELAPKTVEIFSELVRSGVVRPHDLVFDALTGEWAPARAHPMVQLFLDPLVADPTAESVGRRIDEGRHEPSDTETRVELPDGGELALQLVDHDPASPEEEARAFIAKMEEERRNDPDTPALSREIPLVDAGVGAVVGLVPSSDRDPDAEPRRRSPSVSAPPLAREVDPWITPTRDHPVPRRGPGLAHVPRGWANPLILGGAVVALALSVLWPPYGARDALEAGVAEAEGAGIAARAVPVTEEQTREMALDVFLSGLDDLREELTVGDVPRMWLEGRYLADPGAYPEVRSYWERYLAYVDAARAAEVTLYRGAYLTAASDAGLSGPVRSLRLAAAQEDFAALRARREELYRRVEGLAQAALALDDLARGLKGRVTYEPIAGPRVSADPVIEAAGVDPEAQARLEEALDRVLAALQRPGGVAAGDREGVPGWLAAGLREVEEGGVTGG